MTGKSTRSIVLALLILGATLGLLYSRWSQGTVIAEAGAGTLQLRQVPTRAPGLNDAYAYRSPPPP